MTSVALQNEFETTSPTLALGAALLFHGFLFMWNPTLMTGGSWKAQPALMRVEFKEKLPELVKPVEPPKPVVKKEEKKPVIKKAHKSGLTLTKPVHAKKVLPTVVKPLKAIPHYVPKSSDDDALAAATPHPTASAPVPLPPPSQVFTSPPHLVAKTRGVKVSDIRFQLEEAGTLSGSARSGTPVVAIPLGEESGDQAVLPSAPDLHGTPIVMQKNHYSGYTYHPGEGSGGELAGKNRGGYHGGIIRADAVPDEALTIAANAQSHRDAGAGFEIGGPIGDRGILDRLLPEYPDWAEKKRISGMVKIYFTVRPDGTLRAAMRVLRSSGYSELDQVAKEALAKWRFQPTEASSTAEEAWGVITFHFQLS